MCGNVRAFFACWQISPAFGSSGPIDHRRFTEWTRSRVCPEPHRLMLDELDSRGELDWSRRTIDSVNARALKGVLVGPVLVDQGKKESQTAVLGTFTVGR